LALVPFADTLDYFGHYLAGPILAALIAGPLIALALRVSVVPREVSENDVRASEINEDLRRWVRDRNRQLEIELRGLVNGAGNQLYAGSLVNQAVASMRQALHEYRDEGSAKVRGYSALARSENGLHRRYRQWKRRDAPALGLQGQECIDLARWRQRPHIVSPGSETPDLAVRDDPTADENSIAPLESETGLTWVVAHERRPQ
jgi:hypothetical protein